MTSGKKPDPELVKYLRTHLKRFGAEALSHRLLEEGVDEGEIAAALAEVARRPNASRLLKPILVLGGIAIAILAATVLLSPRNAPPPAESAPPKPATSVDTSTAAAAGEVSHPFIGHSGYVLELPPRYAALSQFKDPDKTVEVVYIYPRGTDPANFVNEEIYAQLGLLRLEASPRRIPEGTVGMDAVRAGVARTLEKSKAPHTTRETRVGGMPALVVDIQGAFPLTQAWVLGGKELYLLTGGAEDTLFTNVLESLHEVSQ